ncbi:SsgA family sporulation/cell division regulator [Streptomyces sp. NPDC093065]|uniref:SsgA family sporulation/cell division regulator n=1 Tax=Streptomyces sp. NPDC093065 TaxID=3366021 RepID=UPI00380D11D7
MPLAELDCALQLVVAADRSIPVSARFSYLTQDPYSVHVTFYVEGFPPVSWVFARDLLTEGAVRPSGLGDVRIWPERTEHSHCMWLELTSPHGRALLTMPAETMTPWLARTQLLVPAGSEEAAPDLDGELSRLLGEVAEGA